jgi:hypothetical protein
MLNYWVSIPLWPIYSTRDLRSDPELKPRTAERLLEPTWIGIQFDYANLICIPVAAFSLFFLETHNAHTVCWVLVAWIIYTYWSNKYCFLRYLKIVEFTSVQLDDCANCMWGVPLSMIASAAAHWASRLGYIELTEGTVFLAALVIYELAFFGLLQFVDDDDDSGKGTYEEVKALLGYDYFNTNPIHVLRSQYCDEGTPLVYFQHGKEYQQGGLWRDWQLSAREDEEMRLLAE